MGCRRGRKIKVRNRKKEERERQKEREQLWFTPGDCWRLRLLAWYVVMCVGCRYAERKVCGCELSVSDPRDGVVAVFCRHTCVQRKAESSPVSLLCLGRKRSLSRATPAKRREREMREGGNERRRQACWKKACRNQTINVYVVQS